MKVLACGGRDYDDYEYLSKTLGLLALVVSTRMYYTNDLHK